MNATFKSSSWPCRLYMGSFHETTSLWTFYPQTIRRKFCDRRCKQEHNGKQNCNPHFMVCALHGPWSRKFIFYFLSIARGIVPRYIPGSWAFPSVPVFDLDVPLGKLRDVYLKSTKRITRSNNKLKKQRHTWLITLSLRNDHLNWRRLLQGHMTWNSSDILLRFICILLEAVRSASHTGGSRKMWKCI